MPSAAASTRSRSAGGERPRRSREHRPGVVATEAAEFEQRESRSPAGTGAPSRSASRSAIGSASRRRATNPSASADGRSSHCKSSTTHSSGCSSAASASRLSAPEATTRRSPTCPSATPNTASSALRCGAAAMRRAATGGAAADAARRTRARSPPPRPPRAGPGSRARPPQPARAAPSSRRPRRRARRARRCARRARPPARPRIASSSARRPISAGAAIGASRALASPPPAQHDVPRAPRSCGREPEEVRGPRIELHVQALARELVAGALEGSAVEPVGQLPAAPGEVGPGQVDAGLRGRVAEVDHDEVARRRRGQHQATSRRWESLSGQPATSHRRQSPSRRSESATASQQALVERAQVVVGRLVRAAAEEHGDVRRGARRAGRRGRAGRPAASTTTTAAARACAGPNVAAARGSSWFSMKRISRSW